MAAAALSPASLRGGVGGRGLAGYWRGAEVVADHGRAMEVLRSCAASLGSDAAEPIAGLLTRCLEVGRRWTECGWASRGEAVAAPRLGCFGAIQECRTASVQLGEE